MRFDVFRDLVIFAYFNATFIDFYAVKSFICIYFVEFPCFTRENAYIKDLNAERIFMNFLCIYLGLRKGGGALMNVYVWKHMVSFYYRTAGWMFTKLGRDELLMVTYMH